LDKISDPDGDLVTVEVHNLPPGARLTPEIREIERTLAARGDRAPSDPDRRLGWERLDGPPRADLSLERNPQRHC
jgi:hypothetical protein